MRPTRGARRGRSPWMVLVVLAALSTALATAQTVPSRSREESGPARSFSVLIDPSAADEPWAPSSVRVSADGAPLEVRDITPIQHWEIVVAVDPALSTEAGASAAARLLAAHLEDLGALGDVRLVSVGNWVEDEALPSDDAATLAAAVDGIPDLGDLGQIESLRQEAGASSAADERLELARQELPIVRWRREALADWLLTRGASGARALFLLEDAYDGRIGAAYGLPEPELDPSGSSALDDARLGAALAAAGWTVFPLRPAAAGSDTTKAPPSTLAAATGGMVLRDDANLAKALALLAGARRITVSFDRPPTFPLPLEVTPASGGTARLYAPQWLDGGLLPGLSAARARQFLSLDEDGDLDVDARLHREGPDASSVIVEIGVDLGSAPATIRSSASLTAGLYVERLDGVPVEVEIRGGSESLGRADRWVAQLALPTPLDPVEMVAVVGLAGGETWGAARLEETDVGLARSAPGLVVEPFDLRPPKAAETEERGAGGPTTIVLLAPEGGSLEGRHRFRTLVTTPSIRKARFYLDGELVEEDDEAPFAARIDLGEQAARHTVSVEGLDLAGNVVGEDSIRLNEPFRSFDVSIDALEVSPGGERIHFEASVEHPTDVAVERVEYYHDEDLLETATEPPWSYSFAAGDIGATDYVRVVAYFSDGRFLEDVRLIASPGSTETVEVNLVQVYVVATDKQGDPVADLTADDFEIRLGGEPQQIQRFAYADEVPLQLALVIDTSPSMWPLMPDTRKAAARFLAQVVTEKDSALVIDFDTRPRVRHPLTDDLGDLLTSLGGLEAQEQGTTALYDSAIFASLELPRGQQRKAVVLLTDGDDYKSRFSLGRAIETAQQAGVPIYVVSLAGIQDPRRQFRRTDLDALTAKTGGEAYYLGQASELEPTYDKIARELRSQYLLAFPTTRQLSEQDLASLRVTVDRKGLELSTVVGGRSVD